MEILLTKNVKNLLNYYVGTCCCCCVCGGGEVVLQIIKLDMQSLLFYLTIIHTLFMYNFKTIINAGIKRLRKFTDLTQEDFAEKVGISVDGLRKLEKNVYAPKADTIDKICATFNISPFDLLIEQPTGDKSSAITTINKKLKTCCVEDLAKINAMIDIIKK